MKKHEPVLCIVDDDASVREALQTLLRSTNRRAAAFESAEAFLSSGLALTAECLILDLQMPGIGGLELQRRLRAAGYGIPTIVLTGHPEQVPRAAALGAAVVLTKPFDPDVLLRAVDDALDAQTSSGEGAEGDDRDTR